MTFKAPPTPSKRSNRRAEVEQKKRQEQIAERVAERKAERAAAERRAELDDKLRMKAAEKSAKKREAEERQAEVERRQRERKEAHEVAMVEKRAEKDDVRKSPVVAQRKAKVRDVSARLDGVVERIKTTPLAEPRRRGPTAEEVATLAALPPLPRELASLVVLAAERDEDARAALKGMEAASDEMALLVDRARHGEELVLEAFRDLDRDERGHDGRIISVLGHASLVQSNRRRGYRGRRDRAQIEAMLERFRRGEPVEGRLPLSSRGSLSS